MSWRSKMFIPSNMYHSGSTAVVVSHCYIRNRQIMEIDSYRFLMKLQQKCSISVTSPVAFNRSTEGDEWIDDLSYATAGVYADKLVISLWRWWQLHRRKRPDVQMVLLVNYADHHQSYMSCHEIRNDENERGRMYVAA